MLFRPNKNNNIDGGNKMKKITSILILVIIISLTGCSSLSDVLSDVINDSQRAVAVAEEFCIALSEDMEKAKEYLHPDSTPSKDELQAFIEEIEHVITLVSLTALQLWVAIISTQILLTLHYLK